MKAFGSFIRIIRRVSCPHHRAHATTMGIHTRIPCWIALTTERVVFD